MEQFQSNFRAVPEQFQSSFSAVSERVLEEFPSNLHFSDGAISEQFQSSFRAVPEQFQSSFRAVFECFEIRMCEFVWISNHLGGGYSEQFQSSFSAIWEQFPSNPVSDTAALNKKSNEGRNEWKLRRRGNGWTKGQRSTLKKTRDERRSASSVNSVINSVASQTNQHIENRKKELCWGNDALHSGAFHFEIATLQDVVSLD